MILKGYVSSVEPDGVRVVLPEKEKVVSPPLVVAGHVGPLQPGDNVVVAVFLSLKDGVIIAKF